MTTRGRHPALLLNVKEVELPPLVPEDETLVEKPPSDTLTTAALLRSATDDLPHWGSAPRHGESVMTLKLLFLFFRRKVHASRASLWWMADSTVWFDMALPGKAEG